jgi:Na+-transporting NADH:ubiquinone oxidoreductase subunit NqrB
MKRFGLFKDARDFQILFLSAFLILGIFNRDWTVRPELIIAILVSAIAAQLIADRIFSSENPSIRSSLITAISLCALLRAGSISTMVIAAAASILSKFLFRYRGKHFFNPSNFGIILVLILTTDAWVSPGQWGNELWFVLLFFATGGMVVQKVGRWDTTGAFLGGYALLEFIRNQWLGWTPDVFVHKMMSGSLLLFSFFMITDPRAIPDRKIARIFWSFFVAIMTYVLRNYYFLPTAPFWALFALSPLTILFDRFLPSKRFEWDHHKAHEEETRIAEVQCQPNALPS